MSNSQNGKLLDDSETISDLEIQECIGCDFADSKNNISTSDQKTSSFITSITETTKTVIDTEIKTNIKSSKLRTWKYNDRYNDINGYKLIPEDYVQGLSYNQMLHHIGVKCKESDKLELLQNIVGLSDESTEVGIKYVREHIGSTIAQEEENVLTKKDFICSPILKDEHWFVAVISKNEINIFDSTLQTKKTLDGNGQLQIGSCKQKVNYLNKKPIQNKNGQICALCSAEFIIEASQYRSLEHLKQNINTICNKVATNVIEVIGPENAKSQLTRDFQNSSKRQLLSLGQSKQKPARNVAEPPKLLQPMGTKRTTPSYLNSFKQCSNLSDKVNPIRLPNTPATEHYLKTAKRAGFKGRSNRK